MEDRDDRRTRKRLATRQSISDAATRLFMKRGFDAVTIDESEEGEDAAVFDATGMGQAGDATDLYQMAVQVVLRDKKASTSYIQRRLSIGYNKAASLVERMEKEGVVSPANHAGKREILVGGGVDRGAFDPESMD